MSISNYRPLLRLLNFLKSLSGPHLSTFVFFTLSLSIMAILVVHNFYNCIYATYFNIVAWYLHIRCTMTLGPFVCTKEKEREREGKKLVSCFFSRTASWQLLIDSGNISMWQWRGGELKIKQQRRRLEGREMHLTVLCELFKGTGNFY